MIANYSVQFNMSTSPFSTFAAPQRSTLFPYTTLFRSYEPESSIGQGVTAAMERGVPLLGVVREQRDAALQDRKSTRLNSSHGYISYAAFCLKKKKILIFLGLEHVQGVRRHVLDLVKIH